MPVTIGGVSLYWEVAFGKVIKYKVSDDAQEGKTAFAEIQGNGGETVAVSLA